MEVKEGLPPRPKQALQMAFPDTSWWQGVYPPLPKLSPMSTPRESHVGDERAMTLEEGSSPSP